MHISKNMAIFTVMLAAGCGGGAPPSPATIGGVVAGLPSGVTVLLVNNASDILSIRANGSFTFNKSVQAGLPYNVTLFTQPTGAFCTLVNGAGAVDQHGTPVTNISVSCEPAAVSLLNYNVGVSVSGLATGNSVSFLNNGRDTLTATGNGLFVFSNSYAPEVLGQGVYSVVVSTNPTGQTCTLANGTGINQGSGFTNFVNVNATCR